MAVLRALLILAVVSALATLPCLITLLLSVGWPRFLRRRGRLVAPGGSMNRRDRRRLARLDKCFGADPTPQLTPDTLPIEKVAADLRRLRRQRAGIAQRSPVWRAAIEDAYDDRLRLACERLGIDEHLTELSGFDREIERVRLEGELEAAGITLHGYEAAAQ
ncbi:hypothetical protein [Virgisporangium aurantiacum]|uniref:Uncharacterized protein n=1 Tax=Virgisporangium aurantiacum TaxID=175570 RepID=A0A8J4E5I4_9ACTN|nr:hypothetical protein [Virgisporangium aurantiacum]GIJ59937.1 hypothetical protein Vau01_074530 [Virgisporangium aurantiacum]